MNSFAVQGGYIIKSARDVVQDGYVIVEGALIRDITTERPPGMEIIGHPHDIVMPGLINLHTHAPMTLFRGLADDLPLMQWLEDHIFPAEKNFVNAEFAYLGTLLAALEMLRSGTTSFCDGYFFEDHVGRAAREAGLRAWIAEGFVGFPTPSIPDPARALDYVRDFINRWKDDELVHPTIFSHGVYTCEPDFLAAAYNLAEEYDILYQIHVCETLHEVRQVREKFHMSPVELLDSIGGLSGRTLAHHCVAVGPGDIMILACRGGSISHNAESNMKLAAGVAPIPAMLRAGITIGIGTDGCASNNNLDMFGEMATVAKLHKVHTHNPTVLDAATVLAMATDNGARALRFNGGRLQKGAPADIIVLNGNHPNLVPIYNPVSHCVYAATGADVRDVIVAGRIVMRDHRCLTIDEEALIKECRQIQRLIART
jgi:5-methylthioadenosine/S-adenosylhomocysteine deaminase